MALATMSILCTVVCSLAVLTLTDAVYDYVKYGRADDGPFPSLINIPYYCYQVPSKGSCNGMFKVWFFDVVRRKCMPMFYSGCGGNNNRFHTQEACYIHCGYKRSVQWRQLK
nr:amyloid-beta A4 protein-like [Maniola hyperantus]